MDLIISNSLFYHLKNLLPKEPILLGYTTGYIKITCQPL